MTENDRQLAEVERGGGAPIDAAAGSPALVAIQALTGALASDAPMA